MKKFVFIISLVIIAVMSTLIVIELFERNRYYHVYLDIPEVIILNSNDHIFLNDQRVGKIVDKGYFTVTLGILKEDSIPHNFTYTIKSVGRWGKNALHISSSFDTTCIPPNDTITILNSPKTPSGMTAEVMEAIQLFPDRLLNILDKIDTTRQLLKKIDSVITEFQAEDQ